MKKARPRYHHGALASALLDEALAQVRARGAEQVSLRGLAQALGVSPSAADQHFPDKDALLVAVGERAFDDLATRMRAATEAVETPGEAGALARFAALGRAYLEFAHDEPHLFRHMFSALLMQDDAGPAHVPSWPCEDLEPHIGDAAHNMLMESIAELSELGLLRDGVGVAQALDVLAWSTVHGFSALVVEGHLPLEAGPLLLALFCRLVLTEDAAVRLGLPALFGLPEAVLPVRADHG